MPTQIKLILERAIFTFLQTLGVALLAFGTDNLTDVQPWLAAASAAAFAAVVSVITSSLQFLTGWHPHGYVDLARAAGVTFLQAFIGVLLTGAADIQSAPWGAALAAAVPVTVIALIKSVAAQMNPTTVGTSIVSNGREAPKSVLDLNDADMGVLLAKLTDAEGGVDPVTEFTLESHKHSDVPRGMSAGAGDQ